MQRTQVRTGARGTVDTTPEGLAGGTNYTEVVVWASPGTGWLRAATASDAWLRGPRQRLPPWAVWMRDRTI